MKKLVLAAAFTGVASSAFAGGLNDATMESDVSGTTVVTEEDVVVSDTNGSSGGLILPIVLLVVLLAAVAA